MEIKFLDNEIVNLESILNQSIIKKTSTEKDDLKKKAEILEKENRDLKSTLQNI